MLPTLEIHIFKINFPIDNYIINFPIDNYRYEKLYYKFSYR